MSETRTLSFPADASAGTLMFGTTKEDMQQLEARGDVEVPADAQVMLQVAEGADLTALTALPADAFAQLSCRSVPAGGLGPIARQTALMSVVLMGEFTDADVAELTNVGETKMVILSSDQLEGTTVGALPLSKEAYLSVSSTALTTAGVVAALSLPVDTVSLQGPSLSAEVLNAVPTIGAKTVALGSDDLDADALVGLIERSPELTSISARSAERESLFDDATTLRLRKGNPALTINGIWYDEQAVQRMATGDVLDPSGVVAPPADPVELTVDNFDELIGGDTPVLVDFTATWCGPCKHLKPTIDEITGELAGRLVVGTLDIDDHKPIAERYSINAIPALLVFRGGEQIARIGSQNKDEILTQLAPVL